MAEEQGAETSWQGLEKPDLAHPGASELQDIQSGTKHEMVAG